MAFFGEYSIATFAMPDSSVVNSRSSCSRPA
jgi:hypothetical protein